MSRLSVGDTSVVIEAADAIEPYLSGGPGGSAVWGDITGTLSDQFDLQSELDAKATPSQITTAINNHEGAADPHPDYLLVAEADALYDPIGEAAAEVTAHEALADPHPGYLTPAEANAAYQPLDSDLTTIATTITAAGLAILDDATNTVQRTTLGLGNVDNTSDANKPVSTATQTALDLKQNLDATLTALAGLDSSAGAVEQTGADAFTKRAFGVGASTSIPTRADADARYAALAHATQHKLGGSDVILLNEFGLPTGSVSFNDQQALSFRIENRTTDPSSPTVGQIWLRTDL